MVWGEEPSRLPCIEEPLMRFVFMANLRMALLNGARLPEGQTAESMYEEYLRGQIDNLVELAESGTEDE